MKVIFEADVAPTVSTSSPRTHGLHPHCMNFPYQNVAALVCICGSHTRSTVYTKSSLEELVTS